MEALMQDFPLTLQHIVWRMERLFARKEIVTKRERGLHRYTYGDLVARARRLAAALHPPRREAGRPRGHAGLEQLPPPRALLRRAVHGRGAAHAEPAPLARAARLHHQRRRRLGASSSTSRCCRCSTSSRADVRTLRHVIVMNDDGRPPHDSATLDYETLLAAESSDYAWPELDERAPAAMCYTSGTTGNPKGVRLQPPLDVPPLDGRAAEGDASASTRRDVVLPIVPMFHANAWGLPYAAGDGRRDVRLPRPLDGRRRGADRPGHGEKAHDRSAGCRRSGWPAAHAGADGRKLPDVHTVMSRRLRGAARADRGARRATACASCTPGA